MLTLQRSFINGNPKSMPLLIIENKSSLQGVIKLLKLNQATEKASISRNLLGVTTNLYKFIIS